MGWRFRRSFKIIPGVRLNLSRSGLSASIGGAPFTVNVGSRGVYGTASLPGTGISVRQRLGSAPGTSTQSQPRSLPPQAPIVPSFPPVNLNPVQEIRSASTELLTSENLQEFKKIIQTTYEERSDIEAQLTSARSEYAVAWRRFTSWDSGFLFKKMFKTSFAERKSKSDTATEKVRELEEQLRLTRIATQFEIAEEQAEPFFRMRDEFAALCECAAIWDKESRKATDRIRERTEATEAISRTRVQFSLGECDLIQWEQRVPHLQNANGGELFLFPGFVLYRAAKHAFSVIDFKDIRLTESVVQFIEAETIPSDSKVIGQSWAKSNKDGSRDRRFANNYQIPLTAYGDLRLKSDSGLWEEYMFSNPEKLARFVAAWNEFGKSFSVAASSASAN